jgi:hypothetical protein
MCFPVSAKVPPLQIKRLATRDVPDAFDLQRPLLPDLRFSPHALLTLIPQIYSEKIEADLRAELVLRDTYHQGGAAILGSFAYANRTHTRLRRPGVTRCT